MASAGSLQRTSGDVSTLRHVKIVDCATTNVPFYPFKGRGRQKGFPKLELRRVDELKNHIKDSQCSSFLITFFLGYQTANKRKASRSPTLMSHSFHCWFAWLWHYKVVCKRPQNIDPPPKTCQLGVYTSHNHTTSHKKEQFHS